MNDVSSIGVRRDLIVNNFGLIALRIGSFRWLNHSFLLRTAGSRREALFFIEYDWLYLDDIPPIYLSSLHLLLDELVLL